MTSVVFLEPQFLNLRTGFLVQIFDIIHIVQLCSWCFCVIILLDINSSFVLFCSNILIVNLFPCEL